MYHPALPNMIPLNLASPTSINSALDFSKVKSVVDRVVKDNTVPSMIVSVWKNGRSLFEYAAGTSGATDEKLIPATLDTVYDLAELTQALVTIPLCMILVEQGKIDLNHRVSRYLPSFNVHGKASVTIGHLLSHTAGLASGVPFYENITRELGTAGFGMLTNRGAKDFILNSILRSSLKNQPEAKQSYSEQGFLLLGGIIELLTGLSLEKAAQKLLLKPIGLRSTSFIDLSLLRRRGLKAIPEMVASMDECPWRARKIWGEVFDENAWAMGGIAGHAGLFSCVNDIQLFCTEYLSALDGRSLVIDEQVLRTFIAGGSFDIQVSYAYGFDTPSRENGMIESGLSSKSFGIHSSTGCSMWIDPEENASIVILSNKLDLQRASRRIQNTRLEIIKNIEATFR